MRRFRTWSLADTARVDRLRATDPRPPMVPLLRPANRSVALVCAVCASTPLLACNCGGYDLFNGFDRCGVGLASVDRDWDGLTDADEALFGTAPDDPDSDQDGLLDGAEFQAGTDPLDPDTDGGGALDGVEAQAGTSPLHPDDDPLFDVDRDGDGLLDLLEAALGTDPKRVDTDGDLLDDAGEFLLSTSGTAPDSDGDGYLDRDEVLAGSSPTDACQTPWNVADQPLVARR